jgi:hypothetical protein
MEAFFLHYKRKTVSSDDHIELALSQQIRLERKLAYAIVFVSLSATVYPQLLTRSCAAAASSTAKASAVFFTDIM